LRPKSRMGIEIEIEDRNRVEDGNREIGMEMVKER
jgi:hypothetical protein